MKRTFTFLMMSLFLCIGTMWAQTEATRMTADQLNAVTERQAIAIECTQITNYNRYYNGTGYTPETGYGILFYWVPVEEGVAGTYYIMRGEGEGDYLQANNITTFGTVDNAAKFHAVKPYNGGAGAENFGGADCYYNQTDAERAAWVRLAFLDNSKWFNFNGMQYNGGTGVWTVLFVHDMSALADAVQVTYIYKIDGKEYVREVVPQEKNSEVSVPEQAFLTVESSEGTIGESDCEIVVNCSAALPFVAAADAESIDTWYYVKMHSNTPKYIQYLADQTYIEWTDAEMDETAKDTYTWAFVGNIFDGFKVVNKAAAKAMQSTADGAVVLVDYADASQYVLDPTRETSEAAKTGFCLRRPDGNNECLNANASAGKVAHWWDNDAGSTFTIAKVEYAVAELVDAFKAQAEAFVGLQGMPGLSSLSAVSEKWAEVMGVVEPLYGSVSAGEMVLKADVEAAMAEMTAVQEVVDYYPTYSEVYYGACDLCETLDPASEEWTALDAVINQVYNVSQVTTVAELEEKVAALEAALAPFYNLNETIEGEWTDITNNGDIVNPDLSSLEAYGQVYWNATNHTNYDAANGVMEFVAGENTAASLIQNEVPFAKGAYRLTGKAYHKGAVNAVMFVGDNEVAIPEAEDFVEFTIEFTAEGAQWGMDYFNIGYSCEFDNAEDVLVVGSLKLEEKKSTTLRALFEEKAMALESLGYEITQFAALHAEQQVVMTETVMPLFEAIMNGQKVLKSEVEKAIEAIDAVMAELNPVTDFYKGDFMDALFAAEELKWEFDEESEEYAALDAAINEANNVAEVTAVAELEAKLEALNAAIVALYNLDETIEGEWTDVTNAGAWPIIDHAELLGLGDYWVATNNTNYDAERGVMEFVAGENTSASLIQEYCPFGQATYRLTGKAFHKGATKAVLFVGEQTVEIPAAAEDATFENAEEHFTTFSIEFTCEAAWGTQLNVGYSCEFDSADDFLVVGGLKLEEKKSTTLSKLFEEKAIAFESLGYEITQFAALHAEQQVVMTETVMPLYEAIMNGQKVLKSEVEKAIEAIDAVMAELNPVADFYKGDFSDALFAAEELKWEFDEESEEYADLDAAINEASNVAEVTTVAELEAKLEALKVVVELIETGIENVEADAETVIYDLNGRRVTEMTKGVYIVNGKKVIKK